VSDANTDAQALMRRVRTVLLDFDGPVCSIFAGYPAPTVAEELATTAAAAGHPVPADYLRNQDPLDVLRFAGTIGPELTALVERQLTRAEVKAADTAEATPGAKAFLAACRSTGRTVAVVSNNSAAAVTRYLERAGWADLVRLIEGRDPFDPQLMKPHPHILLRTLRDLAEPAESAVIVGDSVTDIEAGLAADVWTIGYANKPGKAEAMRDAGADVALGSMADLAEMTERTLGI
jgi:phosphoglycolate phosphatase